MNKSKVIILLVVLNVLLVGICLNFSNKNILLNNEKQIVKEMTQSENEANLQTQINQLNASHKEYVTNVQAYKKQIAEAVTNQGVATSENDEGSVIAENINKILEVGTKIDDSVAATADNITKGKKAWVNGNLITGTGADNDAYYNQGVTEGSGVTPYTSEWLRLCCWPHSSGKIPTWFDINANDYDTLTLQISHHEQFHLYFDGVEQSSSEGTKEYDISNVKVIRFYVGDRQGYTNIKYTLN